MVTLVWFGRDLRLADNPALQAALARGGAIVPVFILDDEDAGPWAPGGAARWWLHGSIESLARDLHGRGARLILRRGAAQAHIEELVAQTGADAVYWNRRYEPWAMARNECIKKALKARAIDARSFNAALLCEPWSLSTQKGEPYRVFTPFWKALQIAGVPEPGKGAPGRIPGATTAQGDALDTWSLRPRAPDWAAGLRARWAPGEAAARARLDRFVEGAVHGYAQRRNLPGVAGTSGLSPHLHFGEVGPRQVWQAAKDAVKAAAARRGGADADDGVRTFLSEIAWREFSYHLLFHFPALPEQPLRAEFAGFPWTTDDAALRRWQRGTTGYPIVDAGMRELWTTGWMHNRVRMIVASFLVKDLLLDWRLGQSWFWDTLVDADLASNSASWQWVAGCGADAAPYFRVFNPVLQAARFDPDGSYVRRWIPELARLPDALLQAPWEARTADLAAAGVELGRTYPAPMLDHGQARERALAAFARIRKDTGASGG